MERVVSLQLRQIHPMFAAEASGIDLRRTPGPELVAEIDAAMDEYGVLVFKGQPLDQDQQYYFTCAFGTLDTGLTKITKPQSRFKHHEIQDISNVTPDGGIAPRGHKRIASALANQLWHSDSSFQQTPGKYSMLSAVILPPRGPLGGGETEFADMRAAYDTLPEATKTRIDPLIAEHYGLYSRIWLGDHDWTDEQKRNQPRIHWPVVRTHPGSGRRSLFIGSHANQIVGWPVPEGRMLLLDLLEHATQRQFVYRHEWEVGDLVIWDNRCTLHRGRSYDYGERRELRRTTTEDHASTAIARVA
jgi:alpha-ketoglutarate-dependent 2,4-dichlorophenoxyacetate dioxygenase